MSDNRGVYSIYGFEFPLGTGATGVIAMLADTYRLGMCVKPQFDIDALHQTFESLGEDAALQHDYMEDSASFFGYIGRGLTEVDELWDIAATYGGVIDWTLLARFFAYMWSGAADDWFRVRILIESGNGYITPMTAL